MCALLDNDPEKQNDMTLIFAHRLIEAVIDFQDYEKANSIIIRFLGRSLMHLNITNPLFCKSYHKMLIKFFEDDSSQIQLELSDIIYNLYFLNSTPGGYDLKVNHYFCLILKETLASQSFGVEDIFRLCTILQLIAHNQTELADDIIRNITDKQISADVFIKETGTKKAVFIVSSLLNFCSKTENKEFAKLSNQILQNYNECGHYTATMTYHSLLRTDSEGISIASYILGEDVKNQLATLFSNHLNTLREEKYGMKFRTSDDFLHSRLTEEEKGSINTLLAYELDYL
jgi:hypothetical protein